MKIELHISKDTLGDFNTDADNERYAAAVKTRVQSEYPDADVRVELTDVNVTSCQVSDDPADEIWENVKLIAAQVWENEAY